MYLRNLVDLGSIRKLKYVPTFMSTLIASCESCLAVSLVVSKIASILT